MELHPKRQVGLDSIITKKRFFVSMEKGAQKLIILTAPSGAGKTSITRYLLDKYPALSFSISAATRAPRGQEVNGIDYHFMSVDAFKQKIDEDAFIEWEMVYEGSYYGTLKSELDRIWSLGKIPMLDIDVQAYLFLFYRQASKHFKKDYL